MKTRSSTIGTSDTTPGHGPDSYCRSPLIASASLTASPFARAGPVSAQMCRFVLLLGSSRPHLVCILLPRQIARPSTGTCVSSSDSIPASHRQSSQPFAFDRSRVQIRYRARCRRRWIRPRSVCLSQGLAAYLMAPAIAQEPLLYEASSNGERMASTSSATGLSHTARL